MEIPECECGGRVFLNTVRKKNQNEGRLFFSCSSCHSFLWKDDWDGTVMKQKVEFPHFNSKKRKFEGTGKILEDEIVSLEKRVEKLEKDMDDLFNLVKNKS